MGKLELAERKRRLTYVACDRVEQFVLRLIPRLGQIVISPNRHFPRFLKPGGSKERKKVDRW